MALFVFITARRGSISVLAGWLGCWIGRKNRRQIEELLFARPYGTERLVVRPAMKPIEAWLALTDQDIAHQVMNTDPRVLLEHGDASALDIGTRSSLLKLVANRYRDPNHAPIRMDVREISVS